MVRGLGRNRRPVPADGSAAGLRAVAQGRADAATTHLLHHSGRYNAPFARALLRGPPRIWSTCGGASRGC